MDSGLVKKAKDLLGHHAFGNDSVKGVSQDYNKPLFVPAFSDSFQAIMGQDVGGRISLDMWKHQYTTHFPQTVRIFKVVKNAIYDQHTHECIIVYLMAENIVKSSVTFLSFSVK